MPSDSGVFPCPIPVELEPRPGLAKTKPAKDARRKRLNSWFLSWCERNGVTERKLVQSWGLSKTYVHEIFEMRRSIQWDDIEALPRGLRSQLVIEWMGYIASVNDASESNQAQASNHR
jgi:hypothetical protein